jgi:tetratricopeptide (TPR) repeat protein
MKIIRWLLSHSFLILVIIAVIYGYMFWGNLAGKDTPAGKAIAYLSDEFVGVREFVDAVKAKQAKLEGAQLPADNEQLSTAEDTAAPVTEQVNNEVASSDIEQQPVSISYSHNSARVEQSSADLVTAESEKSQDETVMATNADSIQSNDTALAVDQVKMAGNNAQQGSINAVAVNEAKEVFVSPDIEKQLSNVDKSGNVIDQSLQGSSVRDTWITARKAFYQRNYELSEQSYQKVIDSTEDNFDAYGELGNVYFNQGKNQQAAAAYFEAAAIMVRKGQVNRARSLTGLLRHLDKSKADELQKLIDSNLS